jgi:hypothetical protein
MFHVTIFGQQTYLLLVSMVVMSPLVAPPSHLPRLVVASPLVAPPLPLNPPAAAS